MTSFLLINFTGLFSINSSTLTAVSASSLPVLSQYKTCPQHHALVLALSSVMQTVAICCPGALIWNSNPCGSGSSNAAGSNADAKPAVLGSPLDRLPIAPSVMPLPSSTNAQGSLNTEVGNRGFFYQCLFWINFCRSHFCVIKC